MKRGWWGEKRDGEKSGMGWNKKSGATEGRPAFLLNFLSNIFKF